MTLRLRLFLVLAGLVVALLAAQLFWVRRLAAELDAEVGAVAMRIGQAVATFIEAPWPPDAAPRQGEPTAHAHRVVVRLEAGPPGADATLPLPPVDGAGEDASPAGAATRERRVVFLRLPEDAQALRVHRPGLGAQRIPIPHEGLQERLAGFTGRMVTATLTLLAAGLVVAAVVAHRVTAPLQRLAAAAREVGRGRLGARVAVAARGEVGEAIAAFDRMAERLEQLDAEARRADEQRHLGEIGEVARGLAHSLRNPLHALGLTVDELGERAGDDDTEASALAAAARRQIDRVDRSLRSFLALAGGGAGAAVSAVEPRTLVDDVVLEALQGGRGGARIRVEEPAGPVPAFAAVEPELRAVVQALVVNAVEASPEGGAVEVELRPAAGPGMALRVRDRGPGLAPAVRERLFTPHLSTKTGGAGMGLYLAHRIATSRYGGDLALDDRPGGGTEAVLVLGPRAAAERA